MSIPGIKSLRKQNARNTPAGRLRRAALVIAVLFGLYCIAGFFIVPGIVQKKLQKTGTDVLGRKVTVEKVRVNPLTLAVHLEGLKIAGRQFETLLGWDDLYVNFDAASVLHRELRFQEVNLAGVAINVAVGEDGRLNFADIIDRLTAKQEGGEAPKADTSKPWPFRVQSLAVSTHKLFFIDHTRSPVFEDTIDGVQFSVMNLTNATGQASAGGLKAEVAPGETIAWNGGLVLAPLASNGRLELRSISIPKLFAHVANRFPFAIRDGKVAADVDYEISVDEKGFHGKIGKARVEVSSLAVTDAKTDKPKVALQSLLIDDVRVSTDARSIDVGAVVLTRPTVRVARDASGIDLQSWLPASAPSGAPAPAAPTASSSPWVVSVSKSTIAGLGIEFLDTTTARPAALSIRELDLSAGPVSSAHLDAPIPLKVTAAIGQGGAFELDGAVAPAPLAARAKVTLTDLSLSPLSPFVETIVPLEINRGLFGFSGEVSYSAPADGAPVIGASLEVNLKQLLVRREGEPLASIDELAVRRLEFASSPSPRLVIAEVALTHPVVNVARGEKGELNVLMPVKPVAKTDAVPADEAKSKAAAAPSIAVDTVSFKDAELNFSDRSLKPSVRVSLNRFSGSVTGLSSESIARAGVDFTGRLEDTADVILKGQINPLADDVFTDLTFALRGFDLQPLSPYLGKYVGRELGQGVSGVNVQVKLSKRKLDSANVVTFSPLTLGTPTNSPDAVKLPVNLALALLRDRNGRIEVDLPVSGSLDDPEFKVGRVIWRVVSNLLAKAATSPFSLIGSMFGGGGDELGYQDFSPGLSVVDAANAKKLEVVGRALKERPSLALDISPMWNAETDPAALRAAQLQHKLLQLLNEEARLQVPPGVEFQELTELSPDGEVRMMNRLAERLGITAAEIAATPAGVAPPALVEAAPAAASEPERRSVIRRVIDFFTPGKPESAPSPAVAKDRASLRSGSPISPQAASMAGVNAAPAFDPQALRARLLSTIPVTEDDLRQLASARGNAIRASLVNGAGIEPERVVLLQPRAGGNRVTLTLR